MFMFTPAASSSPTTEKKKEDIDIIFGNHYNISNIMDHINESALVVYRPSQCRGSFAANLIGSKYDTQFYTTALDICAYSLSHLPS